MVTQPWPLMVINDYSLVYSTTKPWWGGVHDHDLPADDFACQRKPPWTHPDSTRRVALNYPAPGWQRHGRCRRNTWIIRIIIMDHQRSLIMLLTIDKGSRMNFVNKEQAKVDCIIKKLVDHGFIDTPHRCFSAGWRGSFIWLDRSGTQRGGAAVGKRKMAIDFVNGNRSFRVSRW